MFRTIEIENFQSHEHSVLELVPGVNMIMGSSDAGKSSIVRAILWAARNTPSGFAFRSNFAIREAKTSVGIELSNDAYVIRSRDNGTLNRYECSACQEPLEAFGQGAPPEEIARLLNLSEYGIQSQHDGYFLLAKQTTSGEVARILNRIAGLDVIDEVTKKIESIVRKTKDGIENAKEQETRLTEELKEFAFLPALGHDIEKLEARLKKREVQRLERFNLYDLLKKIDGVNKEIQEWNEWLEIEQDAAEVINLAREADQLVREKNGLEAWLNNYDAVEEEIANQQEDADNHAKVLKLIEDNRDAYWIREEMRKLQGMLNDLEVLDGEIDDLDGVIQGMEQEREQIGLLCPKCGYRFEWGSK
jgi:DNA repair protein SbcC/Rad50